MASKRASIPSPETADTLTNCVSPPHSSGITSLADNETEMRILSQHSGHSQTGFINLFEKDDSLQQRWADLMNRHPKRFILALDRVFAGSWFKYKEKIYLWRKALAQLDETAAGLIACGNSNKYFKLEIDCRAKRKP